MTIAPVGIQDWLSKVINILPILIPLSIKCICGGTGTVYTFSLVKSHILMYMFSAYE